MEELFINFYRKIHEYLILHAKKNQPSLKYLTLINRTDNSIIWQGTSKIISKSTSVNNIIHGGYNFQQ